MKRNYVASRLPMLALFAISGMAAVPTTAVSAEESQADREYRRIEAEARRQQELARRDIEARERSQAEALRGQEEAIRRMDATRARIEANTQAIAQQSADQARDYTYRYNTPYAATPLPDPLPAPAPRQGSAVNGMSFVTLTERLGSYFGAKSGVLVAGAGAAAPFGLQDGDVILSIDGRVPTDGDHAAAILRSYRPGERVKLQVQRDHRALTFDATVPTQRSN